MVTNQNRLQKTSVRPPLRPPFHPQIFVNSFAAFSGLSLEGFSSRPLGRGLAFRRPHEYGKRVVVVDGVVFHDDDVSRCICPVMEEYARGERESEWQTAKEPGAAIEWNFENAERSDTSL